MPTAPSPTTTHLLRNLVSFYSCGVYKFIEPFVAKRVGSEGQTYLMVGLIFVERLGGWTLGYGRSASAKSDKAAVS